MSISSYSSDHRTASQAPSQDFSHSTPSRQSGMGMVQPVIQEMYATVHAAGSSLFGLFSSCSTFDSTGLWVAGLKAWGKGIPFRVGYGRRVRVGVKRAQRAEIQAGPAGQQPAAAAARQERPCAKSKMKFEFDG
eukprot:scaffold3780_cov101-Isochrysis_galbana.AAC.2